MIGFQQVLRVFDSKPWVAHLYVTEQCNLDCHYCNEYDNSIPHPAVADLKKWMDHIRELGVVRIGFQGGEPLKHPDIVELVRYAKSLGFCQCEHVDQWVSPESRASRRFGKSGARPAANFSRPDDADCEHAKVDEVDRAQARLVQGFEDQT